MDYTFLKKLIGGNELNYDLKFKNYIMNLVKRHSEGDYWDFKAKWHANDVSLLHDIICMANDIEEHDSYIIIGVDEANDFSYRSCKDNSRRKNNNELATFLRSKPFFWQCSSYSFCRYVGY